MYGTKIFILLAVTLVIGSAMSQVIVGGRQPMSKEEAAEVLNGSLAKLAAGDGPSYKLGAVHSASKQLVSGMSYDIECDLIDGDNKTKKCNVNIWSQPWLPNGIKVTFNCEGEAQVVKNHSA